MQAFSLSQLSLYITFVAFKCVRRENSPSVCASSVALAASLSHIFLSYPTTVCGASICGIAAEALLRLLLRKLALPGLPVAGATQAPHQVVSAAGVSAPSNSPSCLVLFWSLLVLGLSCRVEVLTYTNVSELSL